MTRRSLVLPAAIASVTLCLAGGLVFLRDSNPVPLSEAVNRFRASTSSMSSDIQPSRPGVVSEDAFKSAQPSVTKVPTGTSKASERAPVMPAEGVYEYATSGWEEADVLGGYRRDYPARTSVTVRHQGCGYTQRWDALSEHWTESEACLSPRGDRLIRITTYIAFFHYGERDDFRCEEEALSRPRPADPKGTIWTGRCASDNKTLSFRGSVAGAKTMQVGRRSVDAICYELNGRISGDSRGISHADLCVTATAGTLLWKRSSSSGEGQSPWGSVQYREEYELSLLALNPHT